MRCDVLQTMPNLLSYQVRELCTLPALSIHSAIVAQRAATNTYALRRLVLQLVLYDRVVAHLALRSRLVCEQQCVVVSAAV